MNSKKINKLFNKIIILLILMLVFYYGKDFIKDTYSYKNIGETESIKNSSNNLEIYFFDVGQADSILIKNNDDTMLIDAGNKKDGSNLVDYIKSLNIKDIDILVATHPHEDHIGGMSDIVISFNIGKIYMPDVTTNTKIFENLLTSINNKKYNITIPKIGEIINLNDMNFEVIYTGTDETDLNNTSIVLKLTYYKTSYLFTGDATSKTEKKILDKNLSSSVLKVGHHGSEYSSTNDFLDKVSPKYAIISVGQNNKYNHPSNITLKKFEDRNINIYRTDKNGTIKISSNGEKINIETIKTNIDG